MTISKNYKLKIYIILYNNYNTYILKTINLKN